MIIEEPTNIELIDVNGRRKKALGKVNNIEISLGGKCVTKMTLQATSYNIILGSRAIKYKRRKNVSHGYSIGRNNSPLYKCIQR